MLVGLLFYILEQDDRQIGISRFSALSGRTTLVVVIVVIIIVIAVATELVLASTTSDQKMSAATSDQHAVAPKRPALLKLPRAFLRPQKGKII